MVIIIKIRNNNSNFLDRCLRCKVQRKEEVTFKKENSAFVVHSAEVLENVLILNKQKSYRHFVKRKCVVLQ